MTNKRIWVCSSIHTAYSKTRLLAKCNASRRQIVNFFRNISQYRLKKGQNVQFMPNKGVHGTIIGYLLRTSTYGIYIEKFNTFLRKGENSFGILPQNWTRFQSYVIFFNLFAYIRFIMYVRLSLFYATDISCVNFSIAILLCRDVQHNYLKCFYWIKKNIYLLVITDNKIGKSFSNIQKFIWKSCNTIHIVK